MNPLALTIATILLALGALLVWGGGREARNRVTWRRMEEGVCAVGFGLLLIALAGVVLWRGM